MLTSQGKGKRLKRQNGRRCGLVVAALLLTLIPGLSGCADQARTRAAARSVEEQGSGGLLRRVTALLASVPRESMVRFSAADTLHISEPTRHFYRWRLYRSAWTDGEVLLPKGQEIYAAIGRAAEDGLDPRSYGLDMPMRWSCAWIRRS